MRRTLTLVLGVILLTSGAAAGQDEELWPTTDELRAELQAIGYTFAYGHNGEWLGARSDQGAATIRLRVGHAGLSVTVGDLYFDDLFVISVSSASRQAVTAAMETLSRLPVDDDVIQAVEGLIILEGRDCQAIPVPGGSIAVDGRKSPKKDPSSVLLVEQGVEDACAGG